MAISVLGGGISGLSAAYYLLKTGVPAVTIFEKTSRCGGWIKTKKFDEGYLFEAGPRTLRPKGIPGSNTLEMIEELGLDSLCLPINSNHAAAKNRMVFVNNKLCLLPSNFGGIFKTSPPFSKPLVMAAVHDLFTGRSKTALEDESIYDFVYRRFGKEIADFAISPMICGICAGRLKIFKKLNLNDILIYLLGDAKKISVKFLMKDLFEIEQKYGGVLRGIFLNNLFTKSNKSLTPKSLSSKLFKRSQSEKWNIYSFNGGLDMLPRKLLHNLSENSKTKLNLNADCQKVEFSKGGVEMRVDGKQQSLTHLISSVPSSAIADLVDEQHKTLANELRKIISVDVAVINLQYRSTDLLKHNGFGLLVPPAENLPILGIIFDSCCFKMGENTVITVMMGGNWFIEKFGANPSEEHLLEMAIKNVGQILKIKQKPDNFKVNILKKCIPQYTLGHHKRVNGIRSYIREHKLPLSLCGASYDGVGVNDVILSARKAIEGLSV